LWERKEKWTTKGNTLEPRFGLWNKREIKKTLNYTIP
jgi:hypothetical protein